MGRCKYDASLRSLALESGDYAYYCDLMRNGVFDGFKVTNYIVWWRGRDLRSYDVCKCLYSSKKARARRLRLKFETYVKPSASWFLTLTFRDSVLDSTDDATRRVYVRRFLKSRFRFYVANRDFGLDFGREHYHCVVSLPVDGVSSLLRVRDDCGRLHQRLDWSYGFSDWELIGDGDTDRRKLAKYISKLQQHALKATASDERMIFSRNK